jgi:hypothetical protein
MKMSVPLLYFFFIMQIIFAEEVEIRKGLICSATQTRVPDSQQTQQGEPSQQGKSQGKGMTPEERREFPKKIVLERPRLMARLKYLKEWKDDPFAVRKLLLFADQSIQVPAFHVQAEKKINLTKEQKLSIYDQLGDKMVTLEEKEGKPLLHPVTTGDVPFPQGGEEAIATFEAISEGEEQEVDDFVVLFMSGHDDFNLDEKHLGVLRNYLLRGGFLFADSCCGQKGFETGFHRLVEKLFPGKKLEPLPIHHPLFSLVFDLNKIRYTGREKPTDSSPRIEGMQLGCRTAIMYSPDDVSCGWDGHMHGEYVEREMHYQDAQRLGVNLISYCLGYRKLGSLLTKVTISDSSAVSSGREIIFAQVRFQGDCDPDPSAGVHLIEWLRQNLNMTLFPSRVWVNPDADDLFQYPFLYMTGHGKIGFSEQGCARFKEYFEKGGILIADACCGDSSFDTSFREWIQKLFPGEKLKWFKPDHPMFRSYFPLESVSYRSGGRALLKRLLQEKGGLTGKEEWSGNIPYLEGLERNARPMVIYSRFDLGCAWEKQPCLICQGVSEEKEDSFKLFANLLIAILNS